MMKKYLYNTKTGEVLEWLDPSTRLKGLKGDLAVGTSEDADGTEENTADLRDHQESQEERLKAIKGDITKATTVAALRAQVSKLSDLVEELL